VACREGWIQCKIFRIEIFVLKAQRLKLLNTLAGQTSETIKIVWNKPLINLKDNELWKIK